MLFTVAQYCLIIAWLCSLDSSRDFIQGYEMGFISYPRLMLLISDQTLEISVAYDKNLVTKHDLSELDTFYREQYALLLRVPTRGRNCRCTTSLCYYASTATASPRNGF